MKNQQTRLRYNTCFSRIENEVISGIFDRLEESNCDVSDVPFTTACIFLGLFKNWNLTGKGFNGLGTFCHVKNECVLEITRQFLNDEKFKILFHKQYQSESAHLLEFNFDCKIENITKLELDVIIAIMFSDNDFRKNFCPFMIFDTLGMFDWNVRYLTYKYPFNMVEKLKNELNCSISTNSISIN